MMVLKLFKSSPVGLLIAAGLVGPAAMTQALAQQPAQSWERDLQKYYNRDKTILQPKFRYLAQDALRKLHRNLLAKLGLPTNQGALRLEAPQTVEPTFSLSTAGYDRDGDGAVTRKEYLSSQGRGFGPRGGSDRRYQGSLNRLNAQFRNADIDRDGKVTAKELNSLPGTRF
jgi:hypothetical protein